MLIKQIFVWVFFKKLIDKNIFHYYKVDSKSYINYQFITHFRLFKIFYNYYNLIL